MTFGDNLKYLRAKWESCGRKFTAEQSHRFALAIGKKGRNEFNNGFLLVELNDTVWPLLLSFVQGTMTLESNPKTKLKGPQNTAGYKDFVRKCFFFISFLRKLN